jgi:hypothetical protein
MAKDIIIQSEGEAGQAGQNDHQSIWGQRKVLLMTFLRAIVRLGSLTICL